MKKNILLFVIFLLGYSSQGQLITSNSYYALSDNMEKNNDPQKDSFKIFGTGNISDETLKKINAGGKIVLGYFPRPGKTYTSNYLISYNKNASNSDSALSSTLVFPESGSSSFLAHGFWQKNNSSDNGRYHGYFGEFALKTIKNKKDTTDPKFQEFTFNTLHFTAGYKWGSSKEFKTGDATQTVGIELAVFASFVNIPDEDHESFERIINRQATTNSFGMLGAKLSFEINKLQIFADMRHVFGSASDLPVKDLKGFNFNIGFSFNTGALKF